MAGLGRAPEAPDPDSYDKMNVHCDVLVVGGGLAGIAAALAAGEAGAQGPAGGRRGRRSAAPCWASATRVDGMDGAAWARAAAGRLAAMEEVRVLTRTTLFGYYDHNSLSAFERRTDHLGPHAHQPACPASAYGTSRQRRVVLATGAHERPLVFADNDRPGILLASAAQRYVNHYAVRCRASARCFSPTTTRPTRQRTISSRPAARSAPWSIAGPSLRRRWRPSSRSSASRSTPARSSPPPTARSGSAPSQSLSSIRMAV